MWVCVLALPYDWLCDWAGHFPSILLLICNVGRAAPDSRTAVPSGVLCGKSPWLDTARTCRVVIEAEARPVGTLS